MRPPLEHTLRLTLPELEGVRAGMVRHRKYCTKSMENVQRKIRALDGVAGRSELHALDRHYTGLMVTRGALEKLDAAVDAARLEEARRAEMHAQSKGATT